MNSSHIISIEPGNRIQLPSDWVEALSLQGRVVLERAGDTILVRPCRRLTWDEISDTKLVIGSAPPNEADDTMELTGDDFVF